MAEELELKITVDSTDAVHDTKKLENAMDSASNAVDDVGKKSESSFAILSNAAKGAGGALAAMIGADLVGSFFAINMGFDKLRAMLLTATGGAIEAAAAFEQVKAFAATTPFILQQATEGFVKLKNLGLDPTVGAMTAFGDFSAAMGKQLSDMIEAVADASAFEFERLKEFGIKSSQQGDFVTFTFRGLKTTVEKTADSVVAELIRMGQENFGGAMAAQVDTLEGQISNLGDTWSQTVDDMLQDDKIFRDAVAGLTSYIQAFKDSIGDIMAAWAIMEGSITSFSHSVVEVFSTVKFAAREMWLDIQTGAIQAQQDLSKTKFFSLVAVDTGAAMFQESVAVMSDLEVQQAALNKEKSEFVTNTALAKTELQSETDQLVNNALGIKSAAERQAEANRQIDDAAHLLKVKMQHEDAATLAALAHTDMVARGSKILDEAKSPLEKFNDGVKALNENTKIAKGSLEYYEQWDKLKDKFVETSEAAESATEKFTRQKKELDAAFAANGDAELHKTAMANITKEYQKAIEKTDEYKAAKKAQQEIEKAGLKVTESMLTESEKLEIELARLESLHRSGAISTTTYNRAVEELAKSSTNAKEATKEYNKLVQEGQAIFASTETAAEKYQRQLRALKAAYPNEQSVEFKRGLEQITATLTGTMTAQQQYNEYTKQAKDIIAGTETAAEKYARQLLALDNYLLDTDDLAGFQTGLANITAEFKASGEAAGEGSQAFADAAKTIEGSFSNLFSDIFSDAGNSFDNFAESLKKSFVNLLAQLAAEAIKNKIYVALGITAEGGGLGGFISGLGSKLTSGIGELFTNPGGVLEKIGGFVGAIPGLLTGAKWGAGIFGMGASGAASAGAPASGAGGIGPIAGYGIAGLLGGLAGDAIFGGKGGAGGSMGAIAGMFFGGPIGAALGGLLGGALGGLIKDKKPIPDIAGFDTGLAASEIASVVAQDIKDKFRDSFATAQTTSAFGTTIFGRPHGGGNKGGLTPDQWNELAAGLQTRLDAMTALDAVAAEFLSGEEEQAVIDAINIGITGGANKIEVAQAVKERYGIIFGAIDADLAAAFADTVGAVSGIEDTDKVLAAADDLLAIFGAFSANGLGGLDFSTALAMTTKLAGASGDLGDAYNQLAEKTAQYNALFGDQIDAEQAAIDAITGLRGEFEALGYVMPDTKEGFRALVEGLDMTSEAGRDAYLSLLDLAPGFADIAAQSIALDDALAKIATGFDDASVSMSGLLDDSIKKYLEFNFTPEQKQQAIGSEIDTLLTGLEQIIDPAQILDTVSKINQLTNEGFQLLTDEEQAGRAQQYAEFLQQVKDQADAQLIEAREQALQDAQALQQAIRDALQPASDAQLQAAQLQIASAQLAYETAQIPVSVSVSFDTAEVGR